MKSKTSVLCKAVSIATVIVMAILCIIEDGFFNQIKIAISGLLLALLFLSLAVIIDRIEKTKVEQKRINDSIDALSEKINIMLGLYKTRVSIENFKAETAPEYTHGSSPMITSEEDLTWDCPDCGFTELTANTICTKCGYDRNKN